MTTPARPTHTTTARFDADLWARLCLYAVQLNMSKGALIRAAVREFLARLDVEQQLEERVSGRLAEQDRRLGRIEEVLGGLVRGSLRAALKTDL